MKKITFLLGIFLVISHFSFAQHSVARDWNEEILEAIRGDFARPTVHARNLFHSSIIMYDAWAVFDSQAETVFLGKNFSGFNCQFDGIATPGDINAARHEVMSYALFNLIKHRFQNAPEYNSDILPSINTLFNEYGYDDTFTSIDYSNDSYAALGNYLASKIIEFGNQDKSNEANDYNNLYYSSVNDPLILELYEDNTGINPNRWQPLAFDVFVDQSGNTYPLNTPEFLSPEWGEVTPFCLEPQDLNIYNNGTFDCYVYNDPGPPVNIQNSNEDGIDDPYKWHFALVAAWSSHLDPADNTMIDISPGAIGNFDIQNYPETFVEYQAFYDFSFGGDASTGHALNPHTNAPYAPQLVKRADYARVLAEFWADGPDSETPPGHWFTILNYVNDHPLTEKRFNGQGPILSDLEWDVKSYLTLGGAMHDCAINAWGIKGYYDYIRPISAIRYMAGKGQSTDASLSNYDPHGIPLVPGYIELVEAGDPLAIEDPNNIGKVQIYAWRGPDYISDPTTDIAGVDWILGEKWWPYQRATFVTPPFAGYLSGHSTFSRAAAEVLTLITGDPYFPGGMGTFDIQANNFLFFEPGPSADMTLQWATYRDASDQTSLSRIWGGIHPPIDDIRGRIIGEKIGMEAYNLAVEYFNGTLSSNEFDLAETISIYPVPFHNEFTISHGLSKSLQIEMYTIDGKIVMSDTMNGTSKSITLNTLQTGIYFVRLLNTNGKVVSIKKVVKY